jgi:2-methylcitrate dehydratase PrpD
MVTCCRSLPSTLQYGNAYHTSTGFPFPSDQVVRDDRTVARPVSKNSAGLTKSIATSATDFHFDKLRPEVIVRARHCLLDWLGTTVAGSQEPAGRMAQAIAQSECDGATGSTIVGTTLRSGPQSTALANGTAAHALDYDDSNFWMAGHPSAPVVSAALALAEAREISTEHVLEAIVAGHEVAARVGRAVGIAHYLAGWHATGTIGTFAAAAAAGRVLGLDPDQMEQAFGLAATQAAGLKVSFGTMAKPLHAGRAAASGILAALLAEQGFTAGHDAIEAHQGFADTQTTDFDPDRADREMGDRLGIEQTVYKKYACCGGTHGSINALSRLVGDRSFTSDEVDNVRVQVSRQMFDICCIPEPVSGIEGKFSIRHVASLVLAGRSTGPSGFTDTAVSDPGLLALRARVAVAESGRDAGQETRVTLRLTDGSEVTADSDARVPATDSELDSQWTVLCRKFVDLAEPVLGKDATGTLVDNVHSLGRGGSVADLLSPTRP